MQNFFPFANYNGLTVPSKNLSIPKKGNGVFTTIKIMDKIPLFLEKHFDRLVFSSRQLNLKLNLEIIKIALEESIKKNEDSIYAARVTLLENNFMIHFYPIPESKPLQLITVNDTRKIQNLKIIDRAIAQAAFNEAANQGAHDAVFIKHNILSESTNSNIFSLNKKGQIITPPLKENGLAGITRQIILETIDVIEENISLDSEEPLVLTNCLRIQKVVSLNKILLADGDNLLEKLRHIVKKKEDEYINMHK